MVGGRHGTGVPWNGGAMVVGYGRGYGRGYGMGYGRGYGRRLEKGSWMGLGYVHLVVRYIINK